MTKKVFKRKNSVCPNCHKKNFITLGRVNKISLAYQPNSHLVKCKNCKLIWINPLPNEKKFSEYFQENGISHYNPNLIYSLFWKLYSFEMIHEYRLIQKYKNSGMLLDIGVGKGEFLSKFPNQRWEKYAYDPFLTKKDEQKLRKMIGANLNINQFQYLKNYPSDFFDVVILRNVIEHTAEFLSLIKQSYRILKKGGILFIRTPNMDSADFKIFKSSWYVVSMEDHLVFFEKKTLLNILKQSNFKEKFKEPVRGSSPLCLLRSVSTSYPLPFRLVISLGYFLVAPLLGEGADFRIIAQK